MSADARFNVYDGDELVFPNIPANFPNITQCVPNKPLASLAVGESTLLRIHKEVYRIIRIS